MMKPAQNADSAGLTARVTQAFAGAADGTVYPRRWAVGDKITGELAAAAIQMGVAQKIGDPIETKHSKKAAPDPESPFSNGPAKPSQSPQAGPASKKATSSKSKAKRGSSS